MRPGHYNYTLSMQTVPGSQLQRSRAEAFGFVPEPESRTVERELLVEDRDLGNNLEAYYLELENLRTMTVEDVWLPERRRLWELVAHGIERVPGTTRRLIGRAYSTVGFCFFAAAKECAADPLAVRAVFEVLEELEPDWVRAVEDARRLADSPEVLAAWCGLPIEAVLAILEN